MSPVLVVRPSSLGDVVHALALVPDLVAARPGVAIDWVAEEAFVELPLLCPHVRRVIPLGLRRWRHTPFARPVRNEIRVFRQRLREARYDAILDLQEQVKGGIVARTARGVRHGFDRESIREPVAAWFDDVHHRVPRELHFAQRCRLLAGAALGYPVAGPARWRWSVQGSGQDLPLGPFVMALHATSREGKLWPEARWQALLASFAQAGLMSCLPWGSQAEHERSARIAAAVPGAIVPPRLLLNPLATWLARAELVIGVDTGLTHLAAALGTRTVALFTETDPALAGVAIAGPHARDLGGRGRVPSLDEAREAAGALLQAAPRC